MLKVLVFGPNGMLGHEMVRILTASGFEITTAGRSMSDISFRVGTTLPTDLFSGYEYFVNCIGLTTQKIDEKDEDSVREAIQLNAIFPHQLAAVAEATNTRVIQIATDCVFSGQRGDYVETDIHDANDVYGKTKSIGEVASPYVMHIRSSIVGLELKGKKSLMEWVKNQGPNAEIPGYKDRFWNGVTTTAFARVVAGVMQNKLFEPGAAHLVPLDKVSKLVLISLLIKKLSRHDIRVVPTDSGLFRDLTLATTSPARNQRLWEAAGYPQIPTISKLIDDMLC